MGLLYPHWGHSTKTAKQDSFSSVPFFFPERVPQVGLEGKGGEEDRAVEAGVAISPFMLLQTFTQQGIQGLGHPTSLQVPKAVKL